MTEETPTSETQQTPHPSRLTRTRILGALALTGVLCGLCVVWPRLALGAIMTCAVLALLTWQRRQEKRPIQRVVDTGAQRKARAPLRRPEASFPIVGGHRRPRESRSRKT